MHAVAMKPDFMDAAGVPPLALEGAKCACLPTAIRMAMAGLLPVPTACSPVQGTTGIGPL